ncbi:hypothetical protein KVP10_12505 [Candidimonas humi]|uniref:Uncharacterized protein n=1 Tax=Candidimonas humi TaxID=683355 RepID=A0ABV8P0U3_9BURK|nr:hypothetical protein [Candidimonas humi]MBV6305711.1 hypothetical protein [Candidimonas humi]
MQLEGEKDLPLLLAIPIVIALIIFGAIRLYAVTAARFGGIAGVAANVAVVLAAAAIVAWLVQRHRRIHGVRSGGHRMLSLAAGDTLVEVDADHQRGRLRLAGRETQFIFADIASAQAAPAQDAWSLRLSLRHSAPPDWEIPMPGRKEAQRWERIFSLAAAQRL